MKNTTTTTKKIKALADFLQIKKSEIVETDHCFEADDAEYIVLTNEEADEKVKEEIQQSLWAFRASFILGFLDMHDYSGSAVKAFEKMQGQMCEDANPIIEAMIGNKIDAFVEKAVKADGRGHFLNRYDGTEKEVNGLFIYRIN